MKYAKFYMITLKLGMQICAIVLFDIGVEFFTMLMNKPDTLLFVAGALGCLGTVAGFLLLSYKIWVNQKKEKEEEST